MISFLNQRDSSIVRNNKVRHKMNCIQAYICMCVWIEIQLNKLLGEIEGTYKSIEMETFTILFQELSPQKEEIHADQYI